MGLFNTMLGSGESLFKNEEALDLDFVPKLLPYREAQQRKVATAMKPLLSGRTGNNMLIHGAPGIGKTAAVRWVLRDLEETSDDVYVVYVNCWQRTTTYQILVEICNALNYKFTQNKRADELLDVITTIANKKAAVFAFDEVDKVEDFDFLYSLLEKVYKKSVLLITNYKEWLTNLEERLLSRLLPEAVEFKQYTPSETTIILQQRREYAFHPGVWDTNAFDTVSSVAAERHDIRVGLTLMRQAGLAAETAGAKKILLEHATSAISALHSTRIERIEDLEEDTQLVLSLVKENPGKKIGDLYESYKKSGGKGAYKTFQRKVEKLAKSNLVIATKTSGGKEGNTTILTMPTPKTLKDF